jgi:hypothetical protein
MMRLLPYLICLALGLVAGAVLFRRRHGSSSDEWQAKYHELNHRYRDLTRRIKELDKTRYRRALTEVLALLEQPERISPELARSRRDEIEALIGES